MYVLTQSPPRRISKRISMYQPANIRDRLTVLYPSIIIAKMFVCIYIENSIVHVVDKKKSLEESYTTFDDPYLWHTAQQPNISCDAYVMYKKPSSSFSSL